MLRTADLDYDLPPDRIAVRPAEPRDAARMLVLGRDGPDVPRDLAVRDLPGLLWPGDLLVFNTTRVAPARLRGRRTTGGLVEGLFLSERPDGAWEALLRARHVRPGMRIELEDVRGRAAGITLIVVDSAGESGAWVVRPEGRKGGGEGADAILARAGATPLPPYIHRARRLAGLPADLPEDAQRYQTVYARAEPSGRSVAAPTAGLHFTPALLEALARRGIGRADVVLHVGTGTFRPVSGEFVEDHPMHEEWCAMPAPAREAILRARAAGSRVICIGTTALRTVESFAALDQSAEPPASLRTRLLVTPGYRLRWTDGLLTNFHLPRSTLMALVAGVLGRDGVARVKHAYAHAIAAGYRFYSYGDAMLILPR